MLMFWYDIDVIFLLKSWHFVFFQTKFNFENGFVLFRVAAGYFQLVVEELVGLQDQPEPGHSFCISIYSEIDTKWNVYILSFWILYLTIS